MDHHFRVGASGVWEGGLDRYYYGRRANGIYVPRYRNIGADKRDYIRGFGYQGGGSRQGWQRNVAELAFGADFKNELTKPGEWTMGFAGFGETLPYAENRMYLDKNTRDKWGMPVVVFDAELRENEKKMRIEMANDAKEMLEASGLKNVKTYDNGSALGMAIHEMGTARMGRDPKTSVLNAHNQVHAVKNVFMTDGACMTSGVVRESFAHLHGADGARRGFRRGGNEEAELVGTPKLHLGFVPAGSGSERWVGQVAAEKRHCPAFCFRGLVGLLRDHLLPRLDVRAARILLPKRAHLLHTRRLLFAQIVLLGTIAREVVEFPRPAVLGDEFPVADTHGAVAFVLPVERLALRWLPPRNSGARLRPSIGFTFAGYFASARSTAVAMRSMRCPGVGSSSPLREIPAGQCAMSGVEMPPSCTQCLCLRKGVFDTVAHASP